MQLLLSDENLKDLKIGKLVQVTIETLFRDEKITLEEINKMTDAFYSKEVSNSNIPVLKEVIDIKNVMNLGKILEILRLYTFDLW